MGTGGAVGEESIQPCWRLHAFMMPTDTENAPDFRAQCGKGSVISTVRDSPRTAVVLCMAGMEREALLWPLPARRGACCLHFRGPCLCASFTKPWMMGGLAGCCLMFKCRRVSECCNRKRENLANHPNKI